MTDPSSIQPGAFTPTRPRVWLAFALALGAFFLPQEVPLVWYPLNEPGNDIQYLEITCSSDGNGEVKIYENLSRGINELDTISWPISATEQAFTYTFPVPDAPIVELRLDPPANGVSLFIRQMRIIDRRGIEVRRFTPEMFVPRNEIASLVVEPDGWRITSTPGSVDPFLRVELYTPLLARDITPRNIVRCYLSTGYLALMLWILLLAVLFTFWRPRELKDFASHVSFMAALAVMFAFVGNRGLIRNSWHYAQFPEPPPGTQFALEFDLTSSGSSPAQLFWDAGSGFNEADSARVTLAGHGNLQTVRFPLPDSPIRSLRFDPRDDAGWLHVRNVRVVDEFHRTQAEIPFSALTASNQISRLEVERDRLIIETPLGANDPVLNFSDNITSSINHVLQAN